MPKAGKYTYPSRDIDECITILSKVSKKTKEVSFSRGAFAENAGFTLRSSASGIVIGSLTQYGLVDSIDGNIVITELGKEVIHGNGQERSNAIEKAVRRIQLFEDIFEKYGITLDDDNLRHYLRERAGVDLTDINTISADVGKILKKVLPYLKPMNQSTQQESEQPSGEIKEPTPQPVIPQDIESFTVSNDFSIWVKKNPAAIDYCLNQMQSIENWLKYVKSKITVTTFPVVTDDAKGNEENST